MRTYLVIVAAALCSACASVYYMPLLDGERDVHWQQVKRGR